MAIVGQIQVESRRFNGWIDPRYPVGYWQAKLDVTGDATGGNIVIDLLFQSALAERLNSQLYSVERLGISTDENGNRVVRVTATNMGGPAGSGFNHDYAVNLLVGTGQSTNSMAAADLVLLPWFLGSQRLPGISASLSVIGVNVDTKAIRFEAEGYRWDARSILIDGGPQRPPNGPYRS